MRRATKPWFRSFNNTWYVQVSGKQVPLAKGRENQKEAYRRFYELMALETGVVPVQITNVQAAVLFDLFLDWSLCHNEQVTSDFYKYFLQDFADLYGGLEVKLLKPFHITKWLDAKPWGATTRNRAISCVKRALNWAVGEGLVPDNPLKTVRKPQAQRRERILSEDEHHLILDSIKDLAFREFLLALRETGCRPAEIRKVAKEHVDLTNGLWVFHKHKTRGKTGKPRVIYLTPTMIDLTRELLARNPDGPLFRNMRGRAWSGNAIRIRFRNLRKKFPQLNGVTAYVVRHTYCTDALERGVPIATLAELLGHESTRMIDQHYAHLAEKREYLRQAAIRATVPNGS
jgi:integrase